ncbi:hypothetical protein C6Y14_19105 [Streptomyces dioscori]|uniref:Uncharacterized protein n=1 Tax=Streptomyces dioscori TaxID=2109333 RepID=A0A2P8Q6G2_9ACTN|nr:hypothetical protein [Streptomyces dioscori]PSM41835.1 hypothetical protein C6Y14_19105 [Streptomyces dioscori]
MPGTVLLIAASPAGKGCLVDAASVLPVLAAVAPSVLSGTDTANVVELADPLQPQAVLTRLRAAATAPGPLTVFLTGQLQLDRRQRRPHLALARTTPATVRYTGFPWHWIREELRLRAPGSTTLLVDLHTDAETWQHLAGQPLAGGPGVALYGRVAPPPPRRALAVPTYMKSLATILRSGHRPPLAQLHQQALTRSYGEDPDSAHRDLVLAVEPRYRAGVPMPMQMPVPVPVPMPMQMPGSATAHGYAAAPAPAPMPVTAPMPGTASMPVPAPYLAAVPMPAAPPVAAPPPAPAPVDPHAEITAAVQSGRHAEAAVLAEQWERTALRSYGPGADEVVHWMEVRADLAMFAGDAELSCRIWLAVADARLTAGQPADATGVEAAVDRAHHQWGRIGDVARARELGPALADLRGRVPGRRQGALDDIRRNLSRLGTQVSP